MSQAPPPFVPPAPASQRPKNNNTLIIVIVLVVVLVPCIGLAFLGFFGFNFWKRDLQPLVGCAFAMEEVRDSLIIYAEKHGGKLPKAETWQDDVREIYRQELAKNKDKHGPFKVMEADGEWGCEISGDGRKTGIAFNSDLAGKVVKDIKEPDRTILVFEVDKPALNAHEPYKVRSKKDSPRVFGEERGWLKMPVRGDDETNDMNFQFGSGSKRVRVGKDEPGVNE